MLQAKQVAARQSVPEPRDGVTPVVVVGEYVVGATLPINSIIEMGAIPAGTFITGYKLVCDDVDSGGSPAVTFRGGIISGRYGSNDDTRTIGTEMWSTDQTTMQAGGVVGDTKANALLQVPTTADRGFGIKITAAPATVVAGARIRMYVTCMPDPGNLS